MAEKGDVSAEGSALVERDEDLDNLPRGIAVLTQMMQTVLQRIDAMASVQEGTSGQDVGHWESFASSGAPGAPIAEAGGRVAGVNGKEAMSVQVSSPPKTAGAQGSSPTEQRMAGPSEQQMARSDSISQTYWWETVL